MRYRIIRMLTGVLLALVSTGVASAQDAAVSSAEASPRRWSVSFDGNAFLTINHQSGPRGDSEAVSQNWLMGMGMRPLGRGLFTVTGMLSAEPFTVPGGGYVQLFQTGEAYRGLQITDHQHPHDLLMQISAAWRLPVGQGWGLTLAAAPRGEAALGPVAFMHRPSAADNPSAPLSHHIFDSTHIAGSVLMVGADRGALAVEGSWFHGREPDGHRYGLEWGRPDSWSARVSFRPNASWMFQTSHGRLHEPEELEPGDQRRTNASASWLRHTTKGFTALTVAAGRNEHTFSAVRAWLLEATTSGRYTTFYTRFEDVTTETEVLLLPQIVHRPHPNELVDPVRSFSAGGVVNIGTIGGALMGIGADASVAWPSPILQFTHGRHPTSVHLFVRVRPAGGRRMWNMTMGMPMSSGAPDASGTGHMHH